MTSEAALKIRKAKATLVLDHPFWAVAALSAKYVEADHSWCPTMCTDGKTIWYSPKFTNELSHKEVVGVLAHEIDHILSLHHVRRGDRNPKKWNVAADYVINFNLKRDGFVLPEGHLDDPQYRGMSAEEIYSLLPDQPESGKICIGDVIDPEDMSEAEFEAKALLTESVQTAKRSQGTPPGRFAEMFDGMNQSKVDWRTVLQRYMQQGNSRKYMISRPNRRFVSQRVYLPGRVKDGVSTLNVIGDSSGSVTSNDWKQFLGEFEAIREDVGFDEIRMIVCDACIQSDEIYDDSEPLNVPCKGRGGTVYTEAFAAIDNDKPIIVFTDGYFHDPPVPENGNDVLWIVTETGNADPRTYGETVQIS